MVGAGEELVLDGDDGVARYVHAPVDAASCERAPADAARCEDVAVGDDEYFAEYGQLVALEAFEVLIAAGGLASARVVHLDLDSVLK